MSLHSFTHWVQYSLLDSTAKTAADALAAKVKKNPAAHDFQIALVGLKWEIVDLRTATVESNNATVLSR